MQQNAAQAKTHTEHTDAQVIDFASAAQRTHHGLLDVSGQIMHNSMTGMMLLCAAPVLAPSIMAAAAGQNLRILSDTQTAAREEATQQWREVMDCTTKRYQQFLDTF